VQSFPATDPARVLVYQHVSPEGQRIPVLSDEQRQVVEAIHQRQAEAARDPAYNGKAVRQ
jgi:hypothetical protein